MNSAPLFETVQTVPDLLHHIERHTQRHHWLGTDVSFAIHTINDKVQYTGMFTGITIRQAKPIGRMFKGNSVHDVLSQIDAYLNTLEATNKNQPYPPTNP